MHCMEGCPQTTVNSHYVFECTTHDRLEDYQVFEWRNGRTLHLICNHCFVHGNDKDWWICKLKSKAPLLRRTITGSLPQFASIVAKFARPDNITALALLGMPKAAEKKRLADVALVRQTLQRRMTALDHVQLLVASSAQLAASTSQAPPPPPPFVIMLARDGSFLLTDTTADGAWSLRVGAAVAKPLMLPAKMLLGLIGDRQRKAELGDRQLKAERAPAPLLARSAAMHRLQVLELVMRAPDHQLCWQLLGGGVSHLFSWLGADKSAKLLLLFWLRSSYPARNKAAVAWATQLSALMPIATAAAEMCARVHITLVAERGSALKHAAGDRVRSIETLARWCKDPNFTHVAICSPDLSRISRNGLDHALLARVAALKTDHVRIFAMSSNSGVAHLRSIHAQN